MPTKKAKQPESFETALTQLEQIVQQLERGELPLEEALNAFKEGIELSQYCQTALTKAEQTVAKMMTPQGEVLLDEDAV
ncbi:exodeoxyribonuclease VII small subunit [Tuanshanicoccus lijuaniae]|uniref:exodeoxyribonuclease VII small subunit n=1 Tax=Aerococcaceae bacterium zg-1292 TaxID=2774330 RepID=UPI001938ECD1|nr:exodeoxyribonuclease VII small subunit [Aerococcaceae bacterium zg-1292]MBF6626088.1 exodeoxyribonuclease VII small subunit [Aerococcaceae bacterium zg-BR9]MBF6978824.1 exodeoxyribonuclease VII small subunit [Aerococcaceae bacterium zg-BR22]MBS4455258.1 exodeoxyribonuclease VII small subunit [Aerococcaceae bacterium zg-A91]MBS4457932.1 exodeoxyribonuclease VII small subunit [Aerococcaceae bacterium zg-BR33]